ncbi:MAG: DUF481 domain-containing protein [Candidatus Omnitrophota bacterium]
MKKILMVLSIALCFVSQSALADEVYLKNGDKLTGKIMEDSKAQVSIETEALGILTIKKGFVERLVTEESLRQAKLEEAKKKESLWKKEASLGYSRTTGNTKDSKLVVAFDATRKTDSNEITLKASSTYASSNSKMDTQKWYTMGRYAFSFSDKKWYNFYKLEADHDRFANIDYRLIPSLGIGYWFNDADDFKAMTEIGLGYEYTNFRTGSIEDEDNMVLIPRVFLEKKLWGKSTISENVYIYPSIDNFEEYRLRSETVFTNPIDDKLSLRVTLIDDYDSDPTGGAKKNDVQITSSLVYNF